MLLTLLPFTAWADDLDNAVATFPTDYVYDGTATRDLPAAATTLQIGGVDVVGAQTVTWTDPDGNAATKISRAGDYSYVLVVSGMSGSVTGKMTVAKKNLGVYAKNVNIKYGAAVPTTFEYVYTAGDICAADKDGDGKPTFPITGESTLSATTTYTQWSAVGNYPITPIVTGLSSTNYAFAPVATGNVVVAQKSLKDDFADFTVATIAAKDFASTATKLAPVTAEGATQEVKVNFGTKKLTYDTDYEVTFNTKADFTGTTDAAGFANAGTYYVKITGKNNYKDVLKIDVPYTIKKAPLLIKTIGAGTEGTHNHVYGSVANVVAVNGTYVTLQGNKTGDNLDNLKTDLQIELVPVDGQADGFAGKYTIKVSGTKAQSEMYTNYTPTYSNQGVYVIKKRPIKITANDKFIAFGEEDGYVEGVVAKAADLTIVSNVTPALDPVFKAGDAIATYPTLKRTAGTTAQTYDLNIVENTVVIKDNSDPKVDVTANYDITLAKGSFTIEAGLISIVPKDVNATYGEKDKALDCDILNMRDQDKSDEFVAMVKKALYIEGADRNVGEHTIKIDASKITLGDLAQYYSSDIQCFTATYTIAKRQLTKIEVKAQSVNTNDYVNPTAVQSGLVKSSKTVVFTADNYTLTEADYNKLITEYQFVTSAATVDGDGKITAATADAKIGIVAAGGFSNFAVPAGVDLTTGTTAVANKYILGALTLSAGAAIAINANATNNANVTVINGAADANVGKKNNVTVSNRSFTTNKWAVMVLPFETTVREISQVFGYAVVDVLDASKGDGNKIYFKLHMGTIKANQPFMVKTDALHSGNLVFNGVTTAKVDAETTPVADRDIDAGGTKFIGLYQQKSLQGAKQLWLSADGDWGYNKKGSAVTVGATRAYLQLPEESTGDAHIFIEEPDGSTTAISIVAADETVAAKDGWYTLNGVKLNDAPVEKGVYINNGKKVVIK